MKRRIYEVSNYIRQRRDIVDLGAGKGEYYHGVDLRKKNIVVVDLSAYWLKHITDWFPTVKSIVGDAKNTSLPEKSFDLVILSQILEHNQDYEPIISEAKRICKDDGYFYVGVPQESYGHGHIHPVWTEKDVIDLAHKFGEIKELKNAQNNWSIYIKNGKN